MLLEVSAFCERVETNLAGLIDELQATTGRRGTHEAVAWQKSLPRLSVLLKQAQLNPFHLSLGQPGNIALEYQLPAASAWCDAVLLGQGPSQPASVMIELKHWQVEGDQPGRRAGLMVRQGQVRGHPSDQVSGYVEYCRNFHSAVLAADAQIHGCVFFTQAADLSAYHQPPNDQLVRDYPVFSYLPADLQRAFPDYLSRRLVRPDPDFARQFEQGVYAQNRSLVTHLAGAILDETQTHFVLLDEQRVGYHRCLEEIDRILRQGDNDEKAVIVIEGPPGSGKSVLAARLWAALAQHPRLQDQVVVFTSTSSSQRTNWEALLVRQVGKKAAGGMIIGANKYNPGLTNHWVTRIRAQGQRADVLDWKQNLQLYLAENRNAMPDNHLAVSVVDEAHALIDPTTQGRRGMASSGYQVQAGPQAWHILRASRFSVFLLDSEQSYRDNETTSPERLAELAVDQGIKRVVRISLAGAQFRAGGSVAYMQWLDRLLGLEDGSAVTESWRRSADGKTGVFGFDIVPDPAALDECLGSHLAEGRSVRLAATYSRPWLTQNETRPHALAPHKMDFHILYVRGGKRLFWSRIWNYAPKSRYELFIQAPPGSPMAEDPLCEVGCPYVIRGFDFDYLGVLWLSDLVWRTDRWQVNLEHVHESAWNLTLGAARREQRNGGPGPATETLLRQLQRGYRILLSRAIRGLYIWFEDDETRRHVEAELAGAGSP